VAAKVIFFYGISIKEFIATVFFSPKRFKPEDYLFLYFELFARAVRAGRMKVYG